MPHDDADILDQLDQHLGSPNQTWLLGAGISKDAGIPLMGALTERVFFLVNNDGRPEYKEIIEQLKQHLPDDINIEDLLSQIADFYSVASRSRDGTAQVGDRLCNREELTDVHGYILDLIAQTIRGGFVPGEAEKVGTPQDPIVSVDYHRAFVRALFKTSQAGLQERRGPVRLFTTNYDTLIEDSLALERVPYWDGFTGGAVAFRTHRFGDSEPQGGYQAHIHKLHGSIDWLQDSEGYVLRVRDNDKYPGRSGREGRVLIHPQATKYVATQRDPFASQFEMFRRALDRKTDNVLIVCGYSFGDDHLNEEIELCMTKPENKTTLIAFISGGSGVPDPLRSWREKSWGQRIYIVTQHGVYTGNEGPYCKPAEGKLHEWWTFQGATNVIKHGSGSVMNGSV